MIKSDSIWVTIAHYKLGASEIKYVKPWSNLKHIGGRLRYKLNPDRDMFNSSHFLQYILGLI